MFAFGATGNHENDSHQKEISDGTLIDEEKIKILAPMIKRVGAKIVLHSGWRFWFDDDMKPLRPEATRLVEMLRREGLSLEGRTPDLTTEEIRRNKKSSLVKAIFAVKNLKSHIFLQVL